MRLMANPETAEIAEVFEEILQRNAPGVLSDAYFAEDYSPLWHTLVADQWTELGLGEDEGGPGFELLDLAVVVERWGRHLVPLPFVPTLLLRRWGFDAHPTARLSYALADPRGLEAPAAPFGGAGTTIVAAVDPTAAAIETTAPGPGWSPSLPLAETSEATAGIDASRSHELVVLVQAEAIGCAESLFDQTVEYARQRVQFGHPIAEYQAVRHRLADMRRDLEMARTAMTWAANEPENALRAANLTLSWCEAVADAAIQLHGGYGFTWEAGLHFGRRHLASLAELFQRAGGRRWPT